MKKVAIENKWAFIFMGIFLLWMLLERVTGLHSTHLDMQQYLTMLYVIPAIWIYVLALKDKRKNYYGGLMTYKQGFTTGIIISVIVAAFSPVTQWIVSYVISPEYFSNVIAYSVETGYHQTLAEAEAQFNYGTYAVQSTIWALVMGVVTSAVVALFTRRKANNGPEPTVNSQVQP